MGAEVEQNLQQRWRDLTSWMTAEKRDQWWEKIKTSYSQPHRKYHNLCHLHQMFQHYDQHKDALQNRYACAYAIFFHDMIYDPHSQDNEEKSAELFLQFSKETTIDQGSFVVDLIKATASHCTEAHLDSANIGTDDIHYFLDFDMAILGADPAEYEEYRKKIREEYNHLDNENYNKGRSKILQLFLKIPNIFATQVFRDKYEAKARNNVETEIKSLGSC